MLAFTFKQQVRSRGGGPQAQIVTMKKTFAADSHAQAFQHFCWWLQGKLINGALSLRAMAGLPLTVSFEAMPGHPDFQPADAAATGFGNTQFEENPPEAPL